MCYLLTTSGQWNFFGAYISLKHDVSFFWIRASLGWIRWCAAKMLLLTTS